MGRCCPNRPGRPRDVGVADGVIPAPPEGVQCSIGFYEKYFIYPNLTYIDIIFNKTGRTIHAKYSFSY